MFNLPRFINSIFKKGRLINYIYRVLDYNYKYFSYNKYIENTIFKSFDIKFIRLNLKQPRNGEGYQVSLTCFWLSLKILISKVVFYLSCIICRFNGEKKVKPNEEQTQFCSNSPTSQMHYDVIWRCHLTNRHAVITVNIGISNTLQ